ncbi:MAG: hypothetical protein ACUVWK_06510 [Nitrososphaerales archaeon]
MPHEIAVATLDGRAYYKIMGMLKEIGLEFDNVMPWEKPNSSVKLVITTEKEKSMINHEKILPIEELGEDIYLAGEKIIDHLCKDGEDSIIVGIDPGKRIGIAIYYRQKEMIGSVLNSMDGAMEKVVRLMRSTQAKKKLVRIGNGDLEMAERMAKELSKRLKNVVIELVDERGTSSLSMMKPKRKVARDQKSAMIIALRQGKRYIED